MRKHGSRVVVVFLKLGEREREREEEGEGKGEGMRAGERGRRRG